MAEEEAQLPTTYAPQAVEPGLYEFWESRGYFQPSSDSGAEPFVITIPPPNVTGELHLGHGLTYSIEDVLGRYKRMRGFATLILPGADHASIAVHTKVEAMLAREGIKRRLDIGREAFLERAWEWKEKYGATIQKQFRALGESYDWSRERFTMDPAYHRAVMTMFVQLYDEGFIYRGSRVINWCPGCHTGISDIEVRPEEREDRLYFVRLPYRDGSGEIVVATVRPETMFGDVAVAVHPDDLRYTSVVGKEVIHPLLGSAIPVIADSFVDPGFGTGAVKITPAHDYADFEVGEHNHLPMPVVITPEATMSRELQAPYAGMPVNQARRAAVSQLETDGALVRGEPLVHNVPLCDRCGTVIEPLLSEQWFMRMDELARPAIDAVKSDRVRFVPDRWSRVYLDWMENIRPWNISRQLWWGQRIPIFTCSNGHVSASVDPPEGCPECRSPQLIQDPDILDTWFSAAVWPFATLGWPERTADLKRFYPTSFMNTSSQILYLWIARMIMMGIHFMGENPFPVVLINPTILNEKGQRMSKSLGTGIDPLETVERYGADATRYGLLAAGSITQQEIRIAGYERAQDGQKFANKIWNAGRFVLQNLATRDQETFSRSDLDLADRWILGRTQRAVDGATGCLESLDLTAGLRVTYDFFWGEFADWYLEIAKLGLQSHDPGRRATVRAVLWSVLDRSLRLLHPYMPFITEHVWQQLRVRVPAGALELSGLEMPLPDSIMIAEWPRHEPSEAGLEGLGADAHVERDMLVVMNVVTAIRNLRAEHGVRPKCRLTAVAVSLEHADLLRQASHIIAGLGRLDGLEVSESGKPLAQAAAVVVDGVTLQIPLSQLTNVEEEKARAERELSRARSEAARLRAQLDNVDFVARAPEPVVSAERAKLDRLTLRLESLEHHLRRLSGGHGD